MFELIIFAGLNFLTVGKISDHVDYNYGGLVLSAVNVANDGVNCEVIPSVILPVQLYRWLWFNEIIQNIRRRIAVRNFNF